MRIGKVNIKSYYLLIILLQAIVGCNNETESPFDIDEIWSCHIEQQWDYQTTRDAIIGKWNWEYGYCCGDVSGVYDNSSEFEGLKIELREDSTGSLFMESENYDFNWDITAKDGDLFGFTTDPAISQLDGRILLCDDIMMCNGSYIDVADNYFRKTE